MGNALFCFALPVEAGPFLRLAGKHCPPEVLITGMGRSNAREALRQRLAAKKPALVISSGFAGALDPDLRVGDVVFDPGQSANLERAMVAAGARHVRFFCADHVVCSASEKRQLRHSTGADAVDMESAGLSEACREADIEFAIVRVISDSAGEDLPVDFNRFITPDSTIDFAKLALWAAVRPKAVMRLLPWRCRMNDAAVKLARVLLAIWTSMPC